MKVIAILAAYNEERFLGGAIDHLQAEGVDVYVIDNESTDRTRRIAESRLGAGVIGIETFPRPGYYAWEALLARKEQLANSLEADWFMHVDADEIHLAPTGERLVEAIAGVEAAGYDVINFAEFTFVPTREEPDHDHPRFAETMRHYYPFLPFSPHLLRAWKRRPGTAGLSASGGHHVGGESARIYPERFWMKHYIFLSIPHAIEKYVRRAYDPAEVESGWHGWRARIDEATIALPSQSELRMVAAGRPLDASSPRTKHFLQQLWEVRSTSP